MSPSRSKRTCSVGGCPNLTSERWCDTHAKNTNITSFNDKRRGSAASRGYDGQWRKTRTLALRRDSYLCQECLKDDRPTPAQEVHHIIGIDVDPTLRLDIDNIISLCASCHKKITEQDQGIFGRKPVNATT